MFSLDQHYCTVHNTKYYRNEKTDATGQVKVWYSHKLADGKGFCVEKVDKKYDQTNQDIPTVKRVKFNSHSNLNDMFACNAMNNAVSLAANGVIPLDQIGIYYKKIYAELKKNKED